MELKFFYKWRLINELKKSSNRTFMELKLIFINMFT